MIFEKTGLPDHKTIKQAFKILIDEGYQVSSSMCKAVKEYADYGEDVNPDKIAALLIVSSGSYIPLEDIKHQINSEVIEYIKDWEDFGYSFENKKEDVSIDVKQFSLVMWIEQLHIIRESFDGLEAMSPEKTDAAISNLSSYLDSVNHTASILKPTAIGLDKRYDELVRDLSNDFLYAALGTPSSKNMPPKPPKI